MDLPDRALLSRACERAIGYLASISDRAVFPTPEGISGLKALDLRLPKSGTDPAEVLRLLDEIGSPATVGSVGPRYFGFVTGGTLPAALAAHWLATAWDQNAVFYRTSPAASVFERVALSWILDVLGLSPDWDGGFVTGTTMAHVSGLAAARHAVLAKHGWDVERDGLFGAPPVTVIAGSEAHATLFKALNLLGLGGRRTKLVPSDAEGRIDPAQIPRVSGPAIVCVQAGNVDSGSVDPLADVVGVAREIGAWVHVDGAFGLWARAAPSRAHLLDGLEGVDSCAADLHKWLNVPYDNGIVLVRKEGVAALHAAMEIRGAYLPAEDRRDPGRSTPDSSRRARGIDAWAALLALGRDRLAEMIEGNCRLARRFADGMRAAGYDVLNDVVLNQVLVSFGDDARTRRVVEAVQADGTCWMGATTWHGRVAMRISVSSWATTDDDVERSLAAIFRVAAGAP